MVLVDPEDRPVGTCEKLEAHRQGLLHRAVSAFVFDRAGQHLLQRRARDKYHSGGLWSNACCSHPRPGETTDAAVARRLQEEMGLSIPLEHRLVFTYRAELGNGLIEHEVDHVYTGRFNGTPRPDPSEVSDWRWVAPAQLERELADSLEEFTAWFRLLYPQVHRITP